MRAEERANRDTIEERADRDTIEERVDGDTVCAQRCEGAPWELKRGPYVVEENVRVPSES